MNAVGITSLIKDYGKLRVLNNINLEVPAGSIYGLIGPNGAGKTTLIKTLIGSVKASSGTIRVLGMEPRKDKWKLRKKCGYMPQEYALYDGLSARNNILFFGEAQNVPDLKTRTEEILAFAELTDRADDEVGNFSGGMKKRVSLCCALIHNPEILFLDEPTAAVDPHLKLQSWALFRKLSQQGVTLFVSTHLMDEALLCDKVTILRQGEILAVDTPKNILRLGKTKMQITKEGIVTTTQIESTPEHAAEELKKFGLSSDVSSVEFLPDNLEEIILRIVEQKKENE